MAAACTVVALALLALPATALPNTRAAFDAWAQAHHRHYPSRAEADHRFDLFRANTLSVSAAARAAPRATYAMDDFADWSPAELAAQRPVLEALLPSQLPWADGEAELELQPLFTAQQVESAAAAGPIDWVSKGAVTTPISQGRCGTCAQFSATGNIEAQWHLAGKHPLVPLAVQEMIDCSSYTGPYGMGWVADVHHGLDRAIDYPLANHSDPTLAGCRSPCNKSAAAKSFAKVDGATCLPPADYSKVAGDDETQIRAWLEHGPLSISVAAAVLNGYKGGVISGAACNTTKVDHAVLLVGFGIDGDGTEYWKLKNSWGPAFGEGGYFRVEHGVHCLGMRGTCQSYIGKPPQGEATAVN